VEHLLATLYHEKSRNSQIFEPIKAFMNCGYDEIKYLLEAGVCKKFAILLVGKDPPEKSNLYGTGIQSISKFETFHMKPSLEVIAKLICACKTQSPTAPPTSVLEASLELPNEDREFIFLNPKTFLLRVIPADLNNDAISLIAQHTAYENKEMTEYWFRIIVTGIEAGINFDSHRLHLEILSKLMDIEDSKEEWRIEQGLTCFLEALKSYLKFADTMSKFTSWLEQITHTNPKVRKFSFKLRPQITEVMPTFEWPPK